MVVYTDFLLNNGWSTIHRLMFRLTLQVYEFVKEFYGGANKVSFSCIDCNNEIGRERKKYLESNDAQTQLEYLKCKQLENPTYFYAMQ